VKQPTAEQMIQKLGEPARKLIENSLSWLDEHEPTWDFLETPVDRWEFIESLLERAKFAKDNYDGQ
jgi:hypothetical protein